MIYELRTVVHNAFGILKSKKKYNIVYYKRELRLVYITN